MRPSWDEYFMGITRAVASRATCLRRNVGAVVVKDKRILTTGYNGAPAGLPHCGEVGCLRQKLDIPSGQRQEICRGLHAEQNAIIQAGLYGVSLQGATIYTTTFPCVTCAKMIINAGISKLVFADSYPDDFSEGFLREAGVEIDRYAPGADAGSGGPARGGQGGDADADKNHRPS
ncbi:MAG: deoxycytidylate deaminase [Bacillota bacterium]